MINLKNANWTNIIYIWTYHTILLIGLPLYLFHATPSSTILYMTVVFYCLNGLAITAGYHRLFSHSTYKANKVVECILLFFGTAAAQGSALRWSYDHRLHHSHVDKDEDPYTVKKGFWHAHILWLFKKEKPITKPAIIADLTRSKLLTFQHNNYVPLVVLTNVLMTFFVYLLTNDFFGAFLFTYILRQFASHHSTWFINSLAHYWGHQNYSTEHTAMDNYIISFLTFGEGYHNYHHTFANDYRNGIKWYHFDPTKWLIWMLSRVGLVKNLRTSKKNNIMKVMVKKHRKALIEKIKNSLIEKKDEAEEKVNQISENLVKKIAELQQLIKAYKHARSEKIKVPAKIQHISRQIKDAKKSLKKDWKYWKRYSKNIMSMKINKKLA